MALNIDKVHQLLKTAIERKKAVKVRLDTGNPNEYKYEIIYPHALYFALGSFHLKSWMASWDVQGWNYVQIIEDSEREFYLTDISFEKRSDYETEIKYSLSPTTEIS